MLNKIEKDIFGSVLKHASDEISNNSCTDLPVRCTKENQEELIDFIKEYCDEDEQDQLLSLAVVGKDVYFQDWMVITWLINKLEINDE